MFEQATLSSGHEAKRVLTTCIGVTTQALIVIGMILVPIIWPDVLPKALLFVPLAGPLTAPPPPPGQLAVRPRTSQTGSKARLPWKPFTEAPASVPKTISIIDDTMDLPPAAGAAGSPLGRPGGIPGSVLDSFFPPGAVPGPVSPPPNPAPTKAPAQAAIAAPMRIGGQVAAALLRRRVDPVYPPLARQMRVSGTVELRGIIGVDGRIRELKVLSGHPLLAKSALDAVSQWIYEPTRLNGQPVEVDAPITVTFRLN